jgi:hypothetical protein
MPSAFHRNQQQERRCIVKRRIAPISTDFPKCAESDRVSMRESRILLNLPSFRIRAILNHLQQV